MERITNFIKKDFSFLIISILIFIIITVGIFSTRNYWPRYDSGSYIVAGLALNQGLGLRDITAPVTTPNQAWSKIPTWYNSNKLNEPNWPLYNQYPPLIPLLLAPLINIGDGGFFIMQLLPWFCGLVSLILIYVLRDFFYKDFFKFVIIAITFSHFSQFATRIQSEIVHLPIILLLLYFFIKITNNKATFSSHILFALLNLLASLTHARAIFITFPICCLIFTTNISWKQKLAAATSSLLFGVMPVLLWTYALTWNGANIFAGNSPYFATYDWQTNGNIFQNNFISIYLSRFFESLPQIFYSTTSDFKNDIKLNLQSNYRVVLTIAFFMLTLFILGTKNYITNKHFNWRILSIILFYLIGCIFSPWFEARMVVPVMPFVLLILILGIKEVVNFSNTFINSKYKPYLSIFITALVALHFSKILFFTPYQDRWSLEYNLLTAESIHINENKKISTPYVQCIIGDHFAYALFSGKQTISANEFENRMIQTNKFLLNGGLCSYIKLGEAKNIKLPLDWRKNFTKIHRNWLVVKYSDKEKLIVARKHN